MIRFSPWDPWREQPFPKYERTASRAKAIGALDLLLLAQLQAVTCDFGAPRLTVLSGSKLRFSIAHFSVKHRSPFKIVLPFPAAQAADCISVSANFYSLPKLWVAQPLFAVLYLNFPSSQPLLAEHFRPLPD